MIIKLTIVMLLLLIIFIVGVPIMCIAMGSIASMLITVRSPIEAEQLIKGNDGDMIMLLTMM